MSEELDLETLGQEWRRIDMKTIEMALATGKPRREFTWGFAVMTAIALFIGGGLFRLAFLASTPWHTRLADAIVVGALLVLFLRFFRRQWLAVRAADGLLTGTPAALVRGRQALLETELYAWASRPARLCELLVAPVGVLLTAAWWWIGNVSAWLPVAVAVGLVSFSAYGRLHRIPALRREVAELEELAASLD